MPVPSPRRVKSPLLRRCNIGKLGLGSGLGKRGTARAGGAFQKTFRVNVVRRSRMFRITVRTQVGPKTQIASGPRRALARFREMRDTYGIDPEVTDGARAYTEEELTQLAEKDGG
jgi:hypothetical protein